MKCFIIAALVSLLFHNGHAYKAAVLEYFPQTRDTPETTMLENLEQYRNYVSKSRDQGVDIIVFPEYGLTTHIVDVEEYAVDLSANTSKVVAELGVMAKENRMYLVVNLIEKVEEENRKIKYYSTSLVFDKNGLIITKYRKINLNNEPKLTPGTELANFTADFSVTFGLLTSDDILVNNPSRTILNSNITDIILPLYWTATIPFYTTLSLEHGYALSTGVNLLAASYGNPSQGLGGSGIYLGDGFISENYIDSTNSTKLIVQEVRKISKREDKSYCNNISPYALPGDSLTPNLTNYITSKEFRASKYKFSKLDLTESDTSTQLCKGSFCCNFNVKVLQPVNASEIYKLAVFDDDVTLGSRKMRVSSCSLLACETDSNDSCGGRLANTTTKFKTIKISGSFKNNSDSFYLPISLKSDLSTVTKSTYCAKSNDQNKTDIEFSTLAETDGVLVFGLIGRSGSSQIQSLGIILITLFSVFKIISV